MVENLLLIGCGKMGQAMLAGWLARGLKPTQLYVIEPNDVQATFAKARGVQVVKSPAEVALDFTPQVIILAVKPQVMAEVVAPIAARFSIAHPTILSIAAGQTVANFQRWFGSEAAIVRAMPNTPAAIGRGMIVAYASHGVGGPARANCDRLLSAMGDIAWIDDEGLMDAVTAVSGSGPAYVFLLIETLAAAGISAGLPEALALRLARQTVAGAAELAIQSPETPADLRRNVTSPNGTTQAALEVLMGEGGLPVLMRRAVLAAVHRSKELAG